MSRSRQLGEPSVIEAALTEAGCACRTGLVMGKGACGRLTRGLSETPKLDPSLRGDQSGESRLVNLRHRSFLEYSICRRGADPKRSALNVLPDARCEERIRSGGGGIHHGIGEESHVDDLGAGVSGGRLPGERDEGEEVVGDGRVLVRKAVMLAQGSLRMRRGAMIPDGDFGPATPLKEEIRPKFRMVVLSDRNRQT